MRDDNYEPKRMFGLPLGEDPSARQGEEQRQVMGMPLDWFGPPTPGLGGWGTRSGHFASGGSAGTRPSSADQAGRRR
jgi:hypothetical protein